MKKQVLKFIGVFAVTIAVLGTNIMQVKAEEILNLQDKVQENKEIKIENVQVRERVKKDSDDGKKYIFNIEEIQVECPVPPEDFEPLEATDEELYNYGFPERPTDKENLKDWESQMRCYKETVKPEISVSKKIEQNSIFGKSLSCTTLKANNWSGFCTKGTQVVSVEGNFKQPTIAKVKKECQTACWVGIGGVETHKLIQCGTMGTCSAKGKTSYYAWYEFIGNDGTDSLVTKIKNLEIRAGDKIYAYCTFERSNNKANFYIANNTTGKSQSIILKNLKSSVYYDGWTADWIVERPLMIGKFSPLANYGTCKWEKCKILTKEGKKLNLSDVSRNKYNMKNSKGSVLSKTSKLSGNSFTTTWKAYE